LQIEKIAIPNVRNKKDSRKGAKSAKTGTLFANFAPWRENMLQANSEA